MCSAHVQKKLSLYSLFIEALKYHKRLSPHSLSTDERRHKYTLLTHTSCCLKKPTSCHASAMSLYARKKKVFAVSPGKLTIEKTALCNSSYDSFYALGHVCKMHVFNNFVGNRKLNAD